MTQRIRSTLFWMAFWGAIVVCAHVGYLKTHPGPNTSTDGRRHTCGVITQDGVTDHLADYWRRCGRSTP